MHIQEGQGAFVEHLAVLVDQRGHLRFVVQGGAERRGVIATLIPQHARHAEAGQRRDVVRVDVASLHMTADCGTAP